ncbi:MAG TPA: hypothetical protein VFW70_24525 [Methylomirabilota bacterium]|nr:hypothetical protein [Methylomirabilota bacterium]
MRARFTAWVAHGNVMLGVIVMIASVLLGVMLFLVWPVLPAAERLAPHDAIVVRVVSAVSLACLGVALGSYLVVRGQTLLVFLEIRQRLVRLDRVARRLDRRSRPVSPPPSRQTERLRPR